MKKFCLSLAFTTIASISIAQTIASKLSNAVEKLVNDVQMKHGIVGFLVMDAATGKVVYQKNGELGLAPASTQKLITSAAALQLLGPSFRYKTQLAYSGSISAEGTLNGSLHLLGSGDPTFGSWRWQATKEEQILQDILKSLKEVNLLRTQGPAKLFVSNNGFSRQLFPDGYIWQDIGNYYGSRHGIINWRENQFDIKFNTGRKEGDPIALAEFNPAYASFQLNNEELLTGEKGSGDNAYVYLEPGKEGELRVAGTLPPAEKRFSISAAHPDPIQFFCRFLSSAAARSGDSSKIFSELHCQQGAKPDAFTVFHTHESPELEKINYWFLRRSINLYGEAFLKTIAFQQTGFGSTDKGVETVRNFWEKNGIDKEAINILDGSGLSPQNRVTAHALAQVLKYARGQSWFNTFYEALPELNGMKMKSGSIGGARSYAGYHKNKSGQEYIFSIIVNNYNGSSSAIVRKMWNVLDVLK
jgi:D-alanyl-D-alanine carboxypeptidase/D-alanyl-D-alanine-endopeptidase (penicillin-binding protein 4)